MGKNDMRRIVLGLTACLGSLLPAAEITGSGTEVAIAPGAPSAVRFDGSRVVISGRYRRYAGVRQFAYHNRCGWLDDVKGLGTFLELEIMAESEDARPAALDRIEEILQSIGHTMADTTRASYLSQLQKQAEGLIV